MTVHHSRRILPAPQQSIRPGSPLCRESRGDQWSGRMRSSRQEAWLCRSSTQVHLVIPSVIYGIASEL
ncbi:hypothetical protein PBY51_022653 [Eleginops maclovinus]|uniref:Uncharacterized protein n=1 Tax=Eleginops maclovinus TaxID=56733 RepID=A0AAN7XBG0_ELEMC|nr:hypothetical protein PBY51_022653 [Eleginops maclovinus]